MNSQLQAFLNHYVRYDEGAKKLASLVDSWPVLESSMIVYRGHREEPAINTAHRGPLYSSSVSAQVAVEEFAGPVCCIFKIHLPAGVHYIDVNKIMGLAHSKAHEKEIIFEKGGEFFTGADAKVKGFAEINKIQGRRAFETYYFPKSMLPVGAAASNSNRNTRKNNSRNKRNLNRNTLINRFGDEYELYNNDLNAFLSNIRGQIKPTERISEEVEKQLREYFSSI